MAQLKIKRTEQPVGSRTLEYGELAIAEDQLYFGNSNNMPVAVGAVLEDKSPKITFSKMYCNNSEGYWDRIGDKIYLVFEYSGDIKPGDELTICRRKLSIEKTSRNRKRHRLGSIIAYALNSSNFYSTHGKNFIRIGINYDGGLEQLLYKTDTLQPSLRIKYIRTRRKIFNNDPKPVLVSCVFSNIVPIVWNLTQPDSQGRKKIIIRPL